MATKNENEYPVVMTIDGRTGIGFVNGNKIVRSGSCNMIEYLKAENTGDLMEVTVNNTAFTTRPFTDAEKIEWDSLKAKFAIAKAKALPMLVNDTFSKLFR